MATGDDQPGSLEMACFDAAVLTANRRASPIGCSETGSARLMTRVWPIHQTYGKPVFGRLLGPQQKASRSRCPVVQQPQLPCSVLKPADPVMKYGMLIGLASQTIGRGDWVHLHNLNSQFDERSGTLDGKTGAPTEDNVYV
jgi:hypothetical protein